MLCAKCGNEIKEGAKFCAKCGCAVPAAAVQTASVEKRCASCGTALKDGAKFCPKCGGVVSIQQQASVPPSAGNTVVNKPAQGNRYATASFVLGIISLIPVYGLFAAIPALIFGLKGEKRLEKQGRARKGKILAIIGLCINGVLIIIGITAAIVGG